MRKKMPPQPELARAIEGLIFEAGSLARFDLLGPLIKALPAPESRDRLAGALLLACERLDGKLVDWCVEQGARARAAHLSRAYQAFRSGVVDGDAPPKPRREAWRDICQTLITAGASPEAPAPWCNHWIERERGYTAPAAPKSLMDEAFCRADMLTLGWLGDWGFALSAQRARGEASVDGLGFAALSAPNLDLLAYWLARGEGFASHFAIEMKSDRIAPKTQWGVLDAMSLGALYRSSPAKGWAEEKRLAREHLELMEAKMALLGSAGLPRMALLRSEREKLLLAFKRAVGEQGFYDKLFWPLSHLPSDQAKTHCERLLLACARRFDLGPLWTHRDLKGFNGIQARALRAKLQAADLDGSIGAMPALDRLEPRLSLRL